MSVLAYLASLSVYEWSCILGAWVLLAVVVGVSLGRGMKRADDDTVPAAYPPPVPAPLPRRESDADWLSAWPVSGAHLIDFDAVHGLLSEPLEQQQVDRMFHEILACEGLS